MEKELNLAEFDYHFGSKNLSVKDVVVSILTEKWPLSAKEIFNSAIKTYGLTVSYQAIHKGLTELEEENIVKKVGKEYSLSKSWIFNQREFFESINKKYNQTQGRYEFNPENEDKAVFRFTDLSVFSVTLGNILSKKELIGKGPNSSLGIFYHGWFPLKFSFLDFETLRRMARIRDNIFTVIKSDSPFDKWISLQYEKAGFNSKYGVFDLNYSSDIGCHGETICKVTFSNETKELMDKIYGKISNLATLFSYYTFESRKLPKVEIKVEFFKDADMAELLRKQIISYFK